MRYNWQQSDWPEFSFNKECISELLITFAEAAGRVSGYLKGLTEKVQAEAVVNLMVSEAVKSAAIEGEFISRLDVMSSIKRNLGLQPTPEPCADLRAQGIGELLVAVRAEYATPLNEAMLFEWHRMLMKGNTQIRIGAWRTHPERMQIISGALGREVVHFEAPPSVRIPDEMQTFIQWFNLKTSGLHAGIIKAAISHLYFESIHPFEDGNGRIGRAVAEKALAQALNRPVLLSLSKAIDRDKKAYYLALQKAQRSNEITDWVIYFLNLLNEAQIDSSLEIEFTLTKVKFLDRFKQELNPRQLKVILRMLEAGHEGFEGGMNARKYVGITKTSKATATRDLQELVSLGAFISLGAGRSTRYNLNLDFVAGL